MGQDKARVKLRHSRTLLLFQKLTASEDTSCILANRNPRHCVHNKSHKSPVLCQTQSKTCIHNQLKYILISSFRLDLGLPSGFYYPLGFLPILPMNFPTTPSLPAEVSYALPTSFQHTNNFLEEYKPLGFSLRNFSSNMSIAPPETSFSPPRPVSNIFNKGERPISTAIQNYRQDRMIDFRIYGIGLLNFFVKRTLGC